MQCYELLVTYWYVIKIYEGIVYYNVRDNINYLLILLNLSM